MKKWMIALVLLSLIFVTGIKGCDPKESAVAEKSNESASTTLTMTAPEITASPNSVSMTAKGDCYPSYCTVFQNIIITSPTPWTSTVPAGSTTVTITYRYQIPEQNDGFIRFRTTTAGEYVEVPVIVK
jgi:hypothetical protein